MEHTPAESIPWAPAPAENFTGETWFGPLDVSDDPEGLVAIGVLFAPGARTDWHHHPGGQTLYVASGAGYVRNTEGETVEISAGDAISIPAGETHWHGATPDSYLMHLSITTGGATEWIDEKVSDSDYGDATRAS
jgi:quercetin dioxygenase-like cupin family protein